MNNNIDTYYAFFIYKLVNVNLHMIAAIYVLYT